MPKPMRLFYLQNIRNCLRIQRFIHILLHFLECYFFSLLWILLVRFVCIYLTPESMISGETEMIFIILISWFPKDIFSLLSASG